MWFQRLALLLVLGGAAGAALAQATGELRWRGGAAPLGLQPHPGAPALPCGPMSLSCATSAQVPLYSSSVTDRSISMRLAYPDAAALKAARQEGPSLDLVGRAGLLADLGVYGRVGTTLGRGNTLAPMPTREGMNYGVGLSWDFSRSASAVLGFDNYDMRGIGGELRDVRATSLGLQWRY
jgi:OmpA-OmpF porin, OOP family